MSTTPHEERLRRIYAYRRLSDQLATAGQPTEEQLHLVANAGFDVVMNLSTPLGAYAIPHEAELIEQLGMVYHGIPVIWEQPTQAKLLEFFEAMERFKDRKVFLHCAANKRVSAFVALHRILKLGWEKDRAISEMEEIWEPNETWSRFIETMLASQLPGNVRPQETSSG